MFKFLFKTNSIIWAQVVLEELIIGNLENRCDVRSEKNAWKNIRIGGEEEDVIMQKWQKLHNEQFCNLFIIVKIERVHPHVLVEDHRDKGDHFVTLRLKGKEHIKVVEVEHLVKLNNVFRFKHHKMLRCIKDKLPIMYVHHSESEQPQLRCFSLEEISSIVENKKWIQIPAIFGGKPFFELKYSEYSDWIDFNNLTPNESYVSHMRKLFVNKS